MRQPSPTPQALQSSWLRQNLADATCRLLFLGACLAQLADTVTTALGLHTAGGYEANILMREAVVAPVRLGVLKLMLAVLLCTVVLLRLPMQRARIALLLALGLGMIAPVHNLIQLITGS